MNGNQNEVKLAAVAWITEKKAFPGRKASGWMVLRPHHQQDQHSLNSVKRQGIWSELFGPFILVLPGFPLPHPHSLHQMCEPQSSEMRGNLSREGALDALEPSLHVKFKSGQTMMDWTEQTNWTGLRAFKTLAWSAHLKEHQRNFKRIKELSILKSLTHTCTHVSTAGRG